MARGENTNLTVGVARRGEEEGEVELKFPQSDAQYDASEYASLGDVQLLGSKWQEDVPKMQEFAANFFSRFMREEFDVSFESFTDKRTRERAIRQAVEVEFDNKRDPRIPILHSLHDWCDMVHDQTFAARDMDPMDQRKADEQTLLETERLFSRIGSWAGETDRRDLAKSALAEAEALDSLRKEVRASRA